MNLALLVLCSVFYLFDVNMYVYTVYIYIQGQTISDQAVAKADNKAIRLNIDFNILQKIAPLNYSLFLGQGV